MSDKNETLLHLRITGRRGIFLIQRGDDKATMVATDAENGAIFCYDCASAHCAHVELLQACGFLAKPAPRG